MEEEKKLVHEERVLWSTGQASDDAPCAPWSTGHLSPLLAMPSELLVLLHKQTPSWNLAGEETPNATILGKRREAHHSSPDTVRLSGDPQTPEIRHFQTTPGPHTGI